MRDDSSSGANHSRKVNQLVREARTTPFGVQRGKCPDDGPDRHTVSRNHDTGVGPSRAYPLPVHRTEIAPVGADQDETIFGSEREVLGV